MGRRQFLGLAAGVFAGLDPMLLRAGGAGGAGGVDRVDRVDRIRGLLLGTLIGDAFGGPVEFQEPGKVQALPRPPKRWQAGERLDETALAEARSRVWLRSYRDLRPEPEPYAHWFVNAPPGTITDDSRHKLILMQALREAVARPERRLGVREYARAHLEWPVQALKRNPEHAKLCDDWIEEWRRGARWVLGERDLSRALPPERMWNGVPTCCGQMSLPPLAAVFPGEPEAAYRAAYELAFFDHGFGRDMNAALVAGLAAALSAPAVAPGHSDAAAWEPVLQAVRDVDPYRHAEIPWMQRPVHRWLDFARKAAREAGNEPARFFETLEQQFRDTTKWEAQVPFTVVFGVLTLARFDPLASLALSLEWGHDTDSYAQLLGAFLGARLGAGVFPAELRDTATHRLHEDTGEDVEEWIRVLQAAASRARRHTLFAG